MESYYDIIKLLWVGITALWHDQESQDDIMASWHDDEKHYGIIASWQDYKINARLVDSIMTSF